MPDSTQWKQKWSVQPSVEGAVYGPPGWPGELSVGRASSCDAATRSPGARPRQAAEDRREGGRQLAAAGDAGAARELGRLAQRALGAGPVRAHALGTVG